LIFPITIVYEASLDTTSHNLLPFELIIHFVFALPAIAGVYIGRFVFKKTTKTATMHQPLEQRLNYQADFRVKYRFFAVEEGGRKTLPYQGYRPAFWYNNDQSHIPTRTFIIWPEFEDQQGNVIRENSQPVRSSGTARMWIITPQMRAYHRDKIRPGLNGYLMEGSRKVAECEVLEIVGLNTNPIHRSELKNSNLAHR